VVLGVPGRHGPQEVDVVCKSDRVPETKMTDKTPTPALLHHQEQMALPASAVKAEPRVRALPGRPFVAAPTALN